MSLNIYGTGLDGAHSVKEYLNGRTRSVSELVQDALTATPEEQSSFLARAQQFQHDMKFCEQMAKLMVNTVKDLNV